MITARDEIKMWLELIEQSRQIIRQCHELALERPELTHVYQDFITTENECIAILNRKIRSAQ